MIISLFGAVPVIGDALAQWIMGDYLPADATLNRFFALHVIALPLVLLLLVVLHIGALHEVGSNNPDGVEIKKQKDANGIPLDGIAVPSVLHGRRICSASAFFLISPRSSSSTRRPSAAGSSSTTISYRPTTW